MRGASPKKMGPKKKGDLKAMGERSDLVPLVNGSVARLYEDRAEYLTDSAAKCPVKWALDLLHEYGVSVQPTVMKEVDAAEQFDSEQLDMFEIVEEGNLAKKYDGISDDSGQVKLKWNSSLRQDDGVPTEGFCLQLREEGSSISFPSFPKALMARQEGKLSLKTRNATTSAEEFQVGGTYALRVELEVPGSTEKEERGVLMQMKAFAVSFLMQRSEENPFLRMRSGVYGNEIALIRVVALFASSIAVSSQTLFDVDMKQVHVHFSPPRFNPVAIDDYQQWIADMVYSDADAAGTDNNLMNQIRQLRKDPYIRYLDDEGNQEANLVDDLLN